APAENDLTLFADYRRQTLRGFFDRLSVPDFSGTLIFCRFPFPAGCAILRKNTKEHSLWNTA
ncbi:hypothetical protein KQI10_01310, partial [Pseudoflavonifractor sp. MSJ-30]|uniref:hypothetical protein n=1 Tax=Pseudoflavonifractor sp. MSJ-30 TaxID=2841525 RepID=UPI001C121678